MFDLLSRHCDADCLFWRDKVAGTFGRIGNGKLYAPDPAVEGIAARTVIRGDRSPAILTHVTPIVGGEDHRLRHWDGAFADFFAVDKKRDAAALAQPTAVIGELHAHLMLAGR